MEHNVCFTSNVITKVLGLISMFGVDQHICQSASFLGNVSKKLDFCTQWTAHFGESMERNFLAHTDGSSTAEVLANSHADAGTCAP